VKYSNEIKVGVTIILATVVFILGVRYFEDLPLFNSTYGLTAEFDNAGGLIAGNIVRVNGVAVGSVNAVYISEESGKVIVDFHVDKNIPVTEGSEAVVAGFDALGVVRLELKLGDPNVPRIPEGGLVSGLNPGDLIGQMTERAPEMMDGADRVLGQLEGVLAEANTMLASPESDFRQTLRAVQGSVDEVETLLSEERERISDILGNVDRLTADLDTAAGEDGEAVTALMDRLNTMMTTLDADLESYSATNEQLQEILRKLNDGDGTLGMLINDPSMYHRLDSTLTGINALVADFQNNPGKYLKEMKLVDLF